MQLGADIRLRGFVDRASLSEAVDWIDRRSERLDGETVALEVAAGRILSAAMLAPEDLPRDDRAAIDGYAIRAAETEGAGDYNPLRLACHHGRGTLPEGSAALISAGGALPGGCDAVLPFAAARRDGAAIEVFAAVPQGNGIERSGQHLRQAAPLFSAGRALRPQDLGLLAALAVPLVSVVRRPRIRLMIAGPKPAGDAISRDASTAMLHGLLARDGGIVITTEPMPTARAALAQALSAPDADAVIAVGRTGAGIDDEAPLALGDAGTLALHGIALRPGGSLALGSVGTVPVILLPGDPLACLCAYDLLAGRLVRRLGGRGAALPYAPREVELGRKIVSSVGTVDLCRVRLSEGRAEPIASAESGGLASAARADGFVLVAEALEGYAPGSRVTMYEYGGILQGF